MTSGGAVVLTRSCPDSFKTYHHFFAFSAAYVGVSVGFEMFSTQRQSLAHLPTLLLVFVVFCERKVRR